MLDINKLYIEYDEPFLNLIGKVYCEIPQLCHNDISYYNELDYIGTYNRLTKCLILDISFYFSILRRYDLFELRYSVPINILLGYVASLFKRHIIFDINSIDYV